MNEANASIMQNVYFHYHHIILYYYFKVATVLIVIKHTCLNTI